MTTPVIINITGGEITPASGAPMAPGGMGVGMSSPAIADIHDMMGDQIGPFPHAGVDGFLSHFIIMIRFRAGPMAGRTVSFTSPPAVQAVSRSEPFIYQGPHANHAI